MRKQFIMKDLINESQFWGDDFQLKENEGISQKKASKLNQFKFSTKIPKEDKEKYFEAFFLTLSMYNYYFFSDKKNDNRLNYISKVVKYKDLYIVPYAINWNEQFLIYYIWGVDLIQLNGKMIIHVTKLELKNLNDLIITDFNPYNYLFLEELC